MTEPFTDEQLADPEIRGWIHPKALATMQRLMNERDAVFDDVTRSCELASKNLEDAYEALEERAEAAEKQLTELVRRGNELIQESDAQGLTAAAVLDNLRAILTEYEPKPGEPVP